MLPFSVVSVRYSFTKMDEQNEKCRFLMSAKPLCYQTSRTSHLVKRANPC